MLSQNNRIYGDCNDCFKRVGMNCRFIFGSQITYGFHIFMPFLCKWVYVNNRRFYFSQYTYKYWITSGTSDIYYRTSIIVHLLIISVSYFSNYSFLLFMAKKVPKFYPLSISNQ